MSKTKENKGTKAGGLVEGLTGDAAIAHALKQCDLDVLAAYPITPQML